ncbi:MAG: hypothetical protein Q9191_007271 [Dirinaria sp. TL-2023a]
MDPVRASANSSWAASKMPSQNGNANGIGRKLEGYFDNRQLPMYKDKPYSYVSSRRKPPPYKRPQILLGSFLVFFGLLYWLGIFSPLLRKSRRIIEPGKVDLSRLMPGLAAVDWEDRRERVKEAFVLSWDGYEKNAWATSPSGYPPSRADPVLVLTGYDVYYPLSKSGRQMAANGMGWIIVDALDTLMIMNLTSRLTHAREWISTSLSYDQDQEVNTFETTIRMLGGFLSAYYLSTTYPDLAPIADDDRGAAGEDLYLEKAADLADRLLGAYESGTGIPYASVNLKSLQGVPSHADGGASSTAEATSVQLEMKYLAILTGEKNYWEKAEKVMQIVDDNGMEDGLLPIFIYADDGNFRGNNIRLGSRGDSYYEYLIKQYLQTSKQEPVYLDMWEQSLAGVRKHLITYSKDSSFSVLAERPNGLRGKISPKMDHLVCFMPGTIALAATGGLTVNEARKAGKWGKKQEDEMRLAEELTKTCWGMYKVMATGLAPEITFFEIDDPPRMESDGVVRSKPMSDDKDASWRSDYAVKPMDSHNLQRPETVESLFYMWRITGDVEYREWGWEMFKAFMKYTAVEDGAGFTSLSDANVIPPALKDNMESFWMAETLKYLYLLFSPTDLLPLDKIVLNTEAHIFPRFELARGLKTGWKRKPRDADGHIIAAEKAEGKEEKTPSAAGTAAPAAAAVKSASESPEKSPVSVVKVEETRGSGGGGVAQERIGL